MHWDQVLTTIKEMLGKQRASRSRKRSSVATLKFKGTPTGNTWHSN